METCLRYNSTDKSLHLHAKENFVSEGKILLQLHGRIDTTTGRPGGRIQLRKKFVPDFLTALDVGARLELESREMSYSVQGKKAVELSDNGLLSVELKAGYVYNSNLRTGTPKGNLELSQKVFNFTDDQDLKIKLGVDLVKRRPYAQLRENNWTLNAEWRPKPGAVVANGGAPPKHVFWSISYDL